LFGQFQFELLQNQTLIGLGLSMAGEDHFASVGGRQVHVEHLPGGEFFQNRTRRQPGGEVAQPAGVTCRQYARNEMKMCASIRGIS